MQQRRADFQPDALGVAGVYVESQVVAAAAPITFDDFLAVDIRVGTVVAAGPFPQARKPALKLVIDFGSGIGRRKSSAQVTEHYTPDNLLGRQVAAVLFQPDHPVPNGSRLF